MELSHEEKIRRKKSSLVRKQINSQSFFITLFNSKRYKELYFSKEALISFLISIVLTIFITILYCANKTSLLNNLQPLLLAILGGFIAMIAFSLSALALIISSISKENIINVIQLKGEKLEGNSEELIDKIIAVLYRFYFSAGFNVLSVILITFMYFYLIIPIEFCTLVNCILGFFSIYILVFSLLFTLTLFSSCIKLPFSF
ncbi:TPA: hypothetical protein R1951_001305 [Staphylococcus delphini]|nr:hypothetical protein [Staphylococcus delphini]HEC2149880.1 hypothetical protein [Staphylococcus delphini]HEC2221203.1 hypothetical protein [Staphylococcus delphini]